MEPRFLGAIAVSVLEHDNVQGDPVIPSNVAEREFANYRVGQIWSPACFYRAHFYIFKGFWGKQENTL